MQGLTFKIEDYKKNTGLTYIEAFLEFCKERELDPEEIINQINKTLKQKIADEFILLGMTKDGRPKISSLEEWF